MKAPKTFLEAVRYFSDPQICLEFLIALRWRRGVKCPQCGSKLVTFLKNAQLWKCRNVHPKQKFSVKDNDAGRFAKAVRGIAGNGLRYAKLVSGDGIHAAPAWTTT